MTPFEREGYTDRTRFRVLKGRAGINKGDIVKLCKDTGTVCPRFATEDGREAHMWLPMISITNGLEVFGEQPEVKTTGSSKELHEKMLFIIDGVMEEELTRSMDIRTFNKQEYKEWRQDIIDTFKLDEGKTK